LYLEVLDMDNMRTPGIGQGQYHPGNAAPTRDVSAGQAGISGRAAGTLPQGQQDQISQARNTLRDATRIRGRASGRPRGMSAMRQKFPGMGKAGTMGRAGAMGMTNKAMMTGDLMNMASMHQMMGSGRGSGRRRGSLGAPNYQGINDADRLMSMMKNRQRDQTGIFQEFGKVNRQGSMQMKTNQALQKKTATYGKIEKSYGVKEKMFGVKEKIFKGMGAAMTKMATGLQAAAKGLDAAAKAIDAAATAAQAVPIVGTAIGAALKVVAKAIQVIAKMVRAMAKAMKTMGKKMEMMSKKMGTSKNRMKGKKVRVKARKVRSKTRLQKGVKNYQQTRKQSQSLMRDLDQNFRHQTAIQKRLRKLGRQTNMSRNPFGNFGNACNRMFGIQQQKAMQMQMLGTGATNMAGVGMGLMQTAMMPGSMMGSMPMGLGMPMMGMTAI